MSHDKLSRREILIAGSTAALGVAAITTGLMNCAKPTSSNASKTDYTFDITQTAYTALATVGGSAYCVLDNADFPAIAVRTSTTEVTAFTSVCTHMGCRVALPINAVATCPCHGSTYNNQGTVIGGPAPSSLKTYATSLSGTTLTITV
jgi:Rieske Fe-S protein